MKTRPVTVVRIYCTEAEHKLDKLLRMLHDEHRVAGVTAFRGIAGFGRSGDLHTTSLVDVSLDLPVVVEFFDRAERIAEVLDALEAWIEPGHLLTWDAHVNESED